MYLLLLLGFFLQNAVRGDATPGSGCAWMLTVSHGRNQMDQIPEVFIKEVRLAIRDVDRMLSNVFHQPGGKVSVVFGESNQNTLYGEVVVSWNLSVGKKRAIVAHEIAHTYFARNIILPNGQTLASALAESQAKVDLCQSQAVLLGQRVVDSNGTSAQPQSDMENLLALWKGANDAFFQANKARGPYLESPVREYNELFADAVSVLLDGNPGAMSEELAQLNRPESQAQPDRFQTYIQQRNFSRDPSNRYFDLNENDPYTFLDFTRHHLWKNYFSIARYKDRAAELLSNLLKAMNHEINDRLLNPQREVSYKKANEQLMHRFDILMKNELPILVNLKRSEAAFPDLSINPRPRI